jgi:hypothetical protein
MRFVCPKLEIWICYYRKIKKCWRGIGEPWPPPPVPPRRKVWLSLSDDVKEWEWNLMLQWLEEHGAADFLCLSDEDYYIVDAQYIEPVPRLPYGKDPSLS